MASTTSMASTTARVASAAERATRVGSANSGTHVSAAHVTITTVLAASTVLTAAGHSRTGRRHNGAISGPITEGRRAGRGQCRWRTESHSLRRRTIWIYRNKSAVMTVPVRALSSMPIMTPVVIVIVVVTAVPVMIAIMTPVAAARTVPARIVAAAAPNDDGSIADVPGREKSVAKRTKGVTVARQPGP